ncbi:MAG: glycosyltransferase family 2 protein [Bacteroidales bacterium]
MTTVHLGVSASPVEGRVPAGTRVSVVVPCRNEAASIGALLDAVERQDWPIEDTILVDDRSADNLVEAVDTWRVRHPGFDVRVVPCRSAGIPAALNTGIVEARGNVIVRLDAHSAPAPDYVRLAMRALFETDAGVVGGVWRIAPGRQNPVGRAIAVAAAHPMGAGDAAYRITHAGSDRRSVDTVPFGCFRKDLWKQLGGFNEHLLTNEDYEFNYRTRASGLTVLLDPRIQSTYWARPNLRALARQYFRYGWWKAQMLKTHPESLRWRQAVPAAFVATVTVLALASALLDAARPPLAVVVLTYAAAAIAASIHASYKRRDWAVVIWLPAVFATMHVCWGGAALINLLTAAHWPPRWAVTARARRVANTAAAATMAHDNDR